MALKEVGDIRSLLSETKTEQPPIHVLFPDGMHKYTKYNDGEGAYILRFNNGLGAKVFFESAKEGDRIALYEVRWGKGAASIQDCRLSAEVLEIRMVPASIGELNGLLESVRDYEPVVPHTTVPAISFPAPPEKSEWTKMVYDGTAWTEKPAEPTASAIGEYTITYTPTETASPSKVLKWEDPA
jgi:hypothetical protein